MVIYLSLPRDFSYQQADVGEQEPCGSTGDCCFEILGEAAAPAEPGEGSLDDPSAGQEFKSFRGVGAFYDLDVPFPDLFEASLQFRACIAAIGEDMLQQRIFLADGFEYAGRTIAILNIGRMDNKPDEVPERIGDDMPFAALDFLARIEPARPARLGRFHRLAIDQARAWRCRAPSLVPRHCDQRLVDACQRTIPAEAVKIRLHRREGCELPGELPPLAASGQHVDNCFNNHAQRYRARPPPSRRRRHERRDQSPFGISQIACIAKIIPAVSPPSGFLDRHFSNDK